jgi:hypothetical protein
VNRSHATRLAVATAGAALALTIGLRADQPPAQSASPAVQTAAEKFKNIQVLTKLPADDLPNAMQAIAASLGVQCGFCHVQGPDGWHFDSDDRPAKATARKMMRMVEAFNNNASNDITINCATCHHGRQEPERTPPLATEMTPEQAAQAQAARGERGGRGATAPGAGRGAAAPGGRGRARPSETVDQVLEKYTQALGGASALAAAKSVVLHGTETTRDLQTHPVTVQETAAGAIRIETEGPRGPMSRTSDGKEAWMTQGDNTRPLDGIQAQQAGRLADLGLPLRAKERYASLAVQRYASLDGVNAIVLTGRPAPDVFEQLYFDRDSGLLLRRVVSTRTAMGVLPEQIDYSDYRDVNGVKLPFQVRYTTWNQVNTMKFSDAKLNAADEAAFRRGQP